MLHLNYSEIKHGGFLTFCIPYHHKELVLGEINPDAIFEFYICLYVNAGVC